MLRTSARPFVLALCLGFASALLASDAAADVVTLAADRDTTLYEPDEEGGNGTGEFLFAGHTNNGDKRRALLYFDVGASIPAGSTINSVSLELYMSRTQAGATPVTLHRVTSDWGEGASVAPGAEGDPATAEQDDATWRYTFYQPADPPSSPEWGSLGGDFDANVSASTSVDGNGFYTWSDAGLAADVAAWVGGTQADYGWIIRGVEAGVQTAKRFNSRQNGNSNRRPELTVDFDPPALTGACCAPIGSCSVESQSSCTAGGGTYQGDGAMCTPNPCPPPVGACCLPTPTATCTEILESSCTAQSGTWQGGLVACTDPQVSCPVVLPPFVDALPIPVPAVPTSGTSGGTASYTMTMRETQQQLHRDLANPTTVWGFGDGPVSTYPGPTIEATTGNPVTVTWANALPGTHHLFVDQCPHGVTDSSTRTVVHLHGGHVPAAVDGYPEATFQTGQQAVYQYPNNQLPATLWYHDHALGITRLNVYMGLAGFYLLRDNVEKALGLPAGEFEIPLAIQDRTFEPDGSLHYPDFWADTFFGDNILVNGKVWPYLDVKRGKYRFRILNGSSSRSYTLALDNAASFQQIGAEGGLLPAPVTLNEITLGPGERADVVMDFQPYAAGTEIVLTNSAPSPFPGQPGEGVVPDVMKFIVGIDTGHTAAVPDPLRSMEILDEADAIHVRDFELDKGPDPGMCAPFTWRVISTKLDGVPFAPDPVTGELPGLWDEITESPELETTEIWRFTNRSGMSHPMHMHLVMFQVIDRQNCDEIGGSCVPIGQPQPPAPQEQGWKDTVQVGPNEIVRVIARFEDFTGLFAYHCHILEHEDHEMMRQFDAVSACSDGVDNDADTLVDFGGGGGNEPASDCTSPDDLSEQPDCNDGIDNDGDGAIDFVAGTGDPGCTSLADPSEKEAGVPCDDGIDNDGDGRIDFDVVTFADVPAFQAGLGDPGCKDASWPTESPRCQDGLNNDPAQDPNPGLVDFDRGASATGSLLSATPDPQCLNLPWRNSESTPARCGLGFELLLLLVPLRRLAKRGGSGRS